MGWPLLAAFVLGLLLGGAIMYIPLRAWRNAHQESLGELSELKELNKFCLDHASHVLTEWKDFKEHHGKED